MTHRARAARIHAYGPPEVLVFENIEVAEPGPTQVLIRNTVIGLNFVEVYYRRGTFPVPAFPAILGNEAVGIVEAVGVDVVGIKVGDRVVYSDDVHGAYSTLCLYPADRVAIVPDDISDKQAASSFLKGLTARYLLKETVNLKAGDTVLYHAAAGGVGQLFTQWAKALGIRVIGTVSSDEKMAIALAAGCSHVINYRTENFAHRVMELTNNVGVKAVFDSVGKDTFVDSLSVLQPRGTLVVFGKASGNPPLINPFDLAPRSLNLTWPVLPVYVATAEQLAVAAQDLFNAITTGIINVEPGRVYPFDQLVDAHRDLEERRTTGATVLIV
ncbi:MULTISPECIES: quinone oxidoreductase [Pseudomonas]|jgi:NADPH2:quinone reductase|uniref:NADPH:quinone reductase n=2 Tax=Pseudomonas fluorescens group TaxID=136843 RepID=A0A024EKG9_9PSED|nr:MULTISPECIES: quinone oxidoreductase [Pseudomonas]AHZ72823.1 putative alcohol dehydrogenase [Pseudomonas mandelii JR-1]OYP99355.1 quinone oxidoreductase [Pseudomonas mandelii]QQN96945.1 quinone oxidoreductase [Pseudomonas sp. SW-3]TWC27782.1 NADPH2:quinone reductase [Pseudomonas sp. SJZ083]TWC53878.1 NADPH2:quinone reductase [Pseudomonas sp. SJZ077]